jgi:sulfotransferase
MNQKLFIQSSMPRAGSTLLQNIMGQNPEFYVTPTSGMVDLVLGARIGYNDNQEAKAGDPELWKKGFYNFCKEGLKGYMSSITNKPYFLDKSRGWFGYYSLLNEIYPDPKYIVMVRDLRDIIASMEKKFRANPDVNDGILNNSTLQGITTHQRAEQYLKSHPVGYLLLKLNQAFLDKTAYNFLFIRYEDLCSYPEEQLTAIYQHLEIPYFKHNFNHIPQITVEDDTVHGIYGDHKIRNTLKALPNDSKEILGEYTYNWIYDQYRWYFDVFGYTK